jgi:hypothetical protein
METDAAASSAGPVNSRPRLLEPCIAVDVFMPKNLINSPILISVLKDTLAFRPAIRYLVKHATDIHLKVEKTVQPSASSYNPANRVLGPPPTESSFKAFKARLSKIKKRIYGYSIFEIDGAFDRIHKSSIISAGRRHSHLVAKPHAVDTHFRRFSADFARKLSALVHNSPFGHQKTALHPHPTYVKNPKTRSKWRLLEVGDERFEFERTGTEFRYQPCLTILEERVLMVRFFARATEEELKGWSADSFSVWTEKLSAAVSPALWDALILIGGFMARRLGEDSKIEDEIWITYDIRALWIWKEGEPMMAADERTQ